jgi:hypothetical protein
MTRAVIAAILVAAHAAGAHASNNLPVAKSKPLPVTTAAACVCGDACACPANSCPGKCPVATAPVQVAAVPSPVAPACRWVPTYDRFGRVTGYTQVCPLKRQ